MTNILICNIHGSNDLSEAVKLIQQGEVVVFPTETVYGLGADALNPNAVKKIFDIKGRPVDNPLIVHIKDMEAFYSLSGKLNKDLIDIVEKLSRKFWPGPLTIIVPKSSKIPSIVTAGLNTVALRIPSHPIAIEFLQQVKTPIAAPSANLSGLPSPTEARDVYEDLQGRVSLIIDGGRCAIGLESTVIDVTEDPPQLLRPGGITAEDIEGIIGTIAIAKSTGEKPKSPGMKYRHYAPRAQVLLIEGSRDRIYQYMKKKCLEFHIKGEKVGILVSEDHTDISADYISVYGQKHDADLFYLASILFHEFREMDRQNITKILVESVTTKGIGLAILNRLDKSSGNKIINLKEFPET